MFLFRPFLASPFYFTSPKVLDGLASINTSIRDLRDLKRVFEIL